MNNWQIGVFVAVAFGLGYVIASWYALIRNEETIGHWTRRALIAENNTDHSRCKTTEDVQARFIAKQEELLDTYRAGKDTWQQADTWLAGQDGAS